MDVRAAQPRPARWEVEQHLLRLAAPVVDQPPHKLSLNARLLEDLGLDSLGVVEFITGIEAELGVGVPDALASAIFSRPGATLGTVAEELLACWDELPPDRSFWKTQRSLTPQPERVPFTQLGGSASRAEWLDGELYVEMGLNREGFAQVMRRTDGMRCVVIPGADVALGPGDADAFPDQVPQHPAWISRFLMDAEPVCCAAYARFLNSVSDVPQEMLAEWCGVACDDPRGSQYPLRRRGKLWEPFPGTEAQPMVLVSWYGANAYSLWAHRQDWRCYREVEADSYLPTEAQWEYAARGVEYRTYPWGQEAPSPDRAAVARHSVEAKYSTPRLPAAEVHEWLGMSPFGLHHMAGNVWQWCRDWYDPGFYAALEAAGTDPVSSTPTGVRSERGGSWVGPGELAASSYRRGRPPGARGRCLGFRCAAANAER